MMKVANYKFTFTLFLMIALFPAHNLAVGQIKDLQQVRENPEQAFPANGMFSGLRWGVLVKNIEEARESRRIWFNNNNKLSKQGDALLAIIRKLRYAGLLPRNYHIDEIDDVMGAPRDLRNIFRLDALFTDAFFSIAYDLKNGRTTPTVGTENDSLLIAMLDQAVKSKNMRAYLDQQEPDYVKYRALKEALKVHLNSLDEDTKSMVMMGQPIDSLPLQKQIQNIEINMERWRWEKQALNGTYIVVNIPSFKLEMFTDDTVVFESKVIVGTPRTPTPVLSSLLECFTTYPYWNVPRSIASTELLSKIQQDTSYLARNNFDVLDSKGNVLNVKSVDWSNYSKSNFPFVLRQREGSDNALGIIKFIFDNPYSVYLHDTNVKSLFKNDVRAYSHGCVRVEKAEELAHFLTTGTSDTLSPVVENYLRQKQRNTIDLPKSVPIYIRYFTSEYKTGELHQYGDIYKKDEKIAGALYK